MHTSVLPVGTRLPSLSDLQRAGGKDLLVKEREAFTGSVHAPEVVGPASTYGRVSSQRSAVADPPVTYPEPARTMMGYVNERDVVPLGAVLLPHVTKIGDDRMLSPAREAAPDALQVEEARKAPDTQGVQEDGRPG